MLVADRECVVEVERDEGGRDVAGEALDDDADLLYIGLDVVGRHETEVGFVGERLRGHSHAKGPALLVAARHPGDAARPYRAGGTGLRSCR